jgi:beta-lactam-binding protein with PASTA domain
MSGVTAFFLRLCLFGLAAFTLVGGTMTLASDRAASPNVPNATPAKRTLVVPEVRGQVYVFAKGILEDAGFSWQVIGAVQGYAANTVQSQRPKPGAIVVDTGAPLVTLSLARNSSFHERGTPENTAPYGSTSVRLAPASG